MKLLSEKLLFELTTDDILALSAELPGRRPKGSARLRMTRKAYRDCVRVLTSREPEFAGVLVGPANDTLVTHFIPDTTGEGTPTQFRVGARRINQILGQYVPLAMDAKGFAHSHPLGSDRLSRQDLNYVQRLFSNAKNDAAEEVLMPIVTGGKFLPFVVRRTNPQKPLKAELVLI